MLSSDSRLPWRARKWFLAGSASAIALACAAPAAAATVTISSVTSNPILMSTANGGGPTDDLVITTTGGVSVPSGKRDHDGCRRQDRLARCDHHRQLQRFDRHPDNRQPDRLGREWRHHTSDRAVDDDRRAVDEPRRHSSRCRSSLTGNLAVDSAASVTVLGDNSQGIDISGTLDGDLILTGSAISINGANAIGLRIAGPVVGGINVGSIGTTGVGSSDLVVTSPVGGTLEIDGTMTATAYTHIVPDATNDPNNDNATQATLINGPGVAIGSNIAGGLIANGPTELEVEQLAAGTFPSPPFANRRSTNRARIDHDLRIQTGSLHRSERQLDGAFEHARSVLPARATMRTASSTGPRLAPAVFSTASRPRPFGSKAARSAPIATRRRSTAASATNTRSVRARRSRHDGPRDRQRRHCSDVLQCQHDQSRERQRRRHDRENRDRHPDRIRWQSHQHHETKA